MAKTYVSVIMIITILTSIYLINNLANKLTTKSKCIFFNTLQGFTNKSWQIIGSFLRLIVLNEQNRSDFTLDKNPFVKY